MKLTKREAYLLSIVMVAAICFLFYNYIYLPLEKDIKSLENKYEDLLDKEATTKALAVKTASLRVELMNIEEETVGVYDGMLERWDQAEMLVYMQGIVENLCDAYVINSYTPMDASTIRSADINMDVATNYVNLQKLIAKLEDGKHYCTIENIAISVKSRDNIDAAWQPMELSANLTVRFYAKGQDTDYPEKYNFMSGRFNKTDVFQE